MLSQLLEDAIRRFKASGIHSPHLDARLLAAYVLGWDAGKIIARPGHVLTSSQCNKLEEMVSRRVGREPIALILGYKEFWGLDFRVTTDVLSPRPDSETLVEAALAIKDIDISELSLLDLGTGTGCLLLALLSELPKSKGLGVDISSAALDVAKENAKYLRMESQACFQLSNWDKDIDGLFGFGYIQPSLYC